jgi:hypothetical protein
MGFLRMLLTSKDNQTWDVLRVGIGLTLVVGLCLETYSVIYLNHPLNWMELGGGAGALFGAGGAGVGLKAKDEPTPTDFSVDTTPLPNGAVSEHVSGYNIFEGPN